MKSFLLDYLACPACLPRENRLQPRIFSESGQDIISADLSCAHCNTVYPVQNGIACLLPPAPSTEGPGYNKYESAQSVASYLWSHYADLLQDPQGSTAYEDWSELMQPASGMFLDTGSAVGRFVFNMAQKFDFAVGLDNSNAFVQASRALLNSGQLKFQLPQEGLLCSNKLLKLPEHWRLDNVEFIVADAQKLPFCSDSFSSTASLNMVDKLRQPLEHLQEAGRVSCSQAAQFLLSDPFSWSPETSPVEAWLGGKAEGDFSGYGLDNITAWLQGENGAQNPAWQIESRGYVWWKLRTHRNHFELIRSCYVKASR